jgi:hypothetical protein
MLVHDASTPQQAAAATAVPMVSEFVGTQLLNRFRKQFARVHCCDQHAPSSLTHAASTVAAAALTLL